MLIEDINVAPKGTGKQRDVLADDCNPASKIFESNGGNIDPIKTREG